MSQIKTIDLYFLGHSETIAAYLVETSAGPALIETGPHSTLPYLKKGLQAYGYSLQDIKHVFLSHIHLDHAGAAWYFAQHGAQIYVHPFGIRHLAAPEKLMASAKRIYQDQMDRLWGEMNAIPLEQLQAIEHEQSIKIGEFEFIAHHTPGHAVHHIAWQIGEDLIAGDVAGVKVGPYPVVPPCPPPDINVEDWQQSIQLIRNLSIQRIHLTHFGQAEDVNSLLDDLESSLIAWANWMKPYVLRQADPKEVTPLFQAYVQQQLIDKGVDKASLQRYEAANPSWMSVAGLMRYWKKREAKSASKS